MNVFEEIRNLEHALEKKRNDLVVRERKICREILREVFFILKRFDLHCQPSFDQCSVTEVFYGYSLDLFCVYLHPVEFCSLSSKTYFAMNKNILFLKRLKLELLILLHV